MMEPVPATGATAAFSGQRPPAAPSDAAVALSAAQLKAQLWADASQQVYAVMLGRCLPALPARLAQALEAGELDDFDCVLPGALEPEEEAAAPYFARLLADSPFTDWLLFEATQSFGGWGTLVSTGARMLALRSHLRGLLQARLPAGQIIDLEWMDPEVLAILLPLMDAQAAAGFFGPMQSVVVTGAQAWDIARLEMGQVQTRRVPLQPAATAQS